MPRLLANERSFSAILELSLAMLLRSVVRKDSFTLRIFFATLFGNCFISAISLSRLAISWSLSLEFYWMKSFEITIEPFLRR